jgi:hypothetical protein
LVIVGFAAGQQEVGQRTVQVVVFLVVGNRVFFERSDEVDNSLVFVRISIVRLSCRVDDTIPEIREVHIVQSLCGHFLVNWSAQLPRGLLDREFLG